MLMETVGGEPREVVTSQGSPPENYPVLLRGAAMPGKTRCTGEVEGFSTSPFVQRRLAAPRTTRSGSNPE
jgi:hypothetical protein